MCTVQYVIASIIIIHQFHKTLLLDVLIQLSQSETHFSPIKNISCNKSDGEDGDTNNKLAFYCLTKCMLTGQDEVPEKKKCWTICIKALY